MIEVVSIKEIIDKYKWDPNKNLNSLRLRYVHRGAANDIKWVEGRNVIMASEGFLEIRGPDDRITYIPFHRVNLIMDEGIIIFDRSKLK